MQMQWQVDNLKCGGCTNRIEQQLAQIEGVQRVSVALETSTVTVEADEQMPAQTIVDTLTRLGYPVTGTTQGLSALEADLRSVVSCALGRLQSSD